MQSGELILQLKQENDQLQFELKDLNYLVQMKEEELEQLHNTVSKVSQLQSSLDQNLYEFEQLHSKIGELHEQVVGATKRESSLEEEMIQSIQVETAYYEMKGQLNSTKAALADLNFQLAEATSLYHQVATLKNKVAALESNVEIILLDNGFLKEELAQYRNESYKYTNE